MKQDVWTSVLYRIRPELGELHGIRKTRAITETTASFVMIPFALVGLVWLITVTDLAQVRSNVLNLAILIAVLLLVEHRPVRIHVSLGGRRRIPVSSSLAGLATWATIITFGPVMLWSQLSAGVFSGLWDSWRARRQRQDAIWVPLSAFMQRLGGGLFTDLMALAAFSAAGGTIPFNNPFVSDWLPVLSITLVKGVMPALISMPILMIFNRYAGAANTPGILIGFVLSLAVFTFPVLPFAVMAPLLYADGNLNLLLFYLLAVILVNFLAHHLSRSNERSQQRSGELARLEALGQAIIQAPADGSTFAEILEAYVPSMFQQDEITIRLFEEGSMLPISAFEMRTPGEVPPVEPTVWDQLQAAELGHFIIRGVVPRGASAAVGDAAVVKISAVKPGEDGDSHACLGGIYLLRRYTQGEVEHSLPVLQALAAQIASALYRAEVYQETLKHERTTQELEFAGHIQASFLPNRLPRISGWELSACLIPARETSGDFYDFIELDSGRIGILVADVADKGMGAALYMALSRTLIRTFAMTFPDQPELALQAANERILNDAKSDQFVTVFYGILDPTKNLLTYANAGHNPAFVVAAPSQDKEKLRRAVRVLGNTGIPLGMFEGMAWRREELAIQPGDTLIMYTDGVSEALNAEAAEFGEQRLLNAVKECDELSAAATKESLLRSIADFVGDTMATDDITIVVAMRSL